MGDKSGIDSSIPRTTHFLRRFFFVQCLMHVDSNYYKIFFQNRTTFCDVSILMVNAVLLLQTLHLTEKLCLWRFTFGFISSVGSLTPFSGLFSHVRRRPAWSMILGNPWPSPAHRRTSPHATKEKTNMSCTWTSMFGNHISQFCFNFFKHMLFD